MAVVLLNRHTLEARPAPETLQVTFGAHGLTLQLSITSLSASFIKISRRASEPVFEPRLASSIIIPYGSRLDGGTQQNFADEGGVGLGHQHGHHLCHVVRLDHPIAVLGAICVSEMGVDRSRRDDRSAHIVLP